MTQPTPSPADEWFRHPLSAPGSAERCYHLLHLGGPVVLHAGRGLWPDAGRRTAFAGVTTGSVQHVLRLAEPVAPGDDPDLPRVGPLRIEAVRPLEEVRLVLEGAEIPLAFDLTYHARFPPAATEPNRIEQDGQVVTDYVNLFQSGSYSGTVVIDGAEHVVADRAGFRDRGWGLRKHEGSPARGLVVAMFCELEAEALYVILYETASGRRVFTNGWRFSNGGIDRLTGAAHRLRFDASLLTGGTVDLAFASGQERTVELEVEGRLFLTPAGYTTDPSRAQPGAERHNVTDPAVVAALDGQNDNACRFRVGAAEGHGYTETGLGEHVTYRPQ
jgi:hypothetical protein